MAQIVLTESQINYIVNGTNENIRLSEDGKWVIKESTFLLNLPSRKKTGLNERIGDAVEEVIYSNHSIKPNKSKMYNFSYSKDIKEWQDLEFDFPHVHIARCLVRAGKKEVDGRLTNSYGFFRDSYYFETAMRIKNELNDKNPGLSVMGTLRLSDHPCNLDVFMNNASNRSQEVNGKDYKFGISFYFENNTKIKHKDSGENTCIVHVFEKYLPEYKNATIQKVEEFIQRYINKEVVINGNSYTYENTDEITNDSEKFLKKPADKQKNIDGIEKRQLLKPIDTTNVELSEIIPSDANITEIRLTKQTKNGWLANIGDNENIPVNILSTYYWPDISKFGNSIEERRDNLNKVAPKGYYVCIDQSGKIFGYCVRKSNEKLGVTKAIPNTTKKKSVKRGNI